LWRLSTLLEIAEVCESNREVLYMTEERRDEAQSRPRDYQRSSQTWRPILIVGAILLVVAVFSTLPNSLAQDDEATSSSATFDELAIMGGVKRSYTSSDFRGGEATAVMGGVDLDLRDAVMEGQEARLDVSSIMGGAKIRVPQSWTVAPRVTTIMGGFKDSTRHPQKDDHKLILEGTVVMGGLQISN
jgi:hypothetical protein